MYKRILVGLGVAGVLVVSAGFLVQPALAQTSSVSEIQAQIKELLARVTELTKQLREIESKNTTPTITTRDVPSSNSWKHRICAALYRNLSQGVSGDDVKSLQEYLREQGYLSGDATGYFGSITAQAVARWQDSEGVQSVGSFGPLSRERIKVWCGGGNAGQRFTATPENGTAPLTVTFNTWISGFTGPGHTYAIDFGDGSSERATNCPAPADACTGPGQNTHTYTTNGLYIATLIHTIDPCAGQTACRAAIHQGIVGKLQIRVGDQIACTKEYKPVCGSKPITCITTPCDPIQQTYSNSCAMEADGATLLYEGQCKTVTTDPSADPQCKTWYDGCNSCSRSAPGGPGMCTLMACSPGTIAARAYCTSYFDGTTTNKPPVISSFSGPTTLAVDGTGTWTILASDPENQQLTYRITWGDGNPYLNQIISAFDGGAFTQSTTFTHAYSSAGTYVISILVRDASGKEAKTTTTVRVGGDSVISCPLEYTPACGTPKVYCPPNALCMEPLPQTYNSRCFLNAEGATFLYSGACKTELVACTADAKQCPDGSYVGRTGPNCEFKCPSSTSTAECTFANTSAGSKCGDKYHCTYGVNGHYWSPTYSTYCNTAR